MSNWSDLAPRVASGLTMAAVAAVGIWFGGPILILLLAICAGLMQWELARICDPAKGRSAIWLGVIGGLATLLGFGGGALIFMIGLPGISGFEGLIAPALVFLALFLPSIAGLFMLSQKRRVQFPYAIAIQNSALMILILRFEGILTVLFIVGIVVITDVAGYFAGRMIGGPKFWPKVSPKKTWSGTIAGWIGAAIFGAVIWSYTNLADLNLVSGAIIAVLISFAGQMGDIIESAMKRRAGIKDASNLIPGHGGFLDRFDAIIGACVMTLVLFLAMVVL